MEVEVLDGSALSRAQSRYARGVRVRMHGTATVLTNNRPVVEGEGQPEKREAREQQQQAG